jgi:TonB family protein
VEERIDLVVEQEKPRAGGIGLAVAISFVLHGLLIVWFAMTYKPAQQAMSTTPMTRYVELIKQNPNEPTTAFTEAPGRKLETAPLNAPLSDGNRKAAMPEPTGDRPTQRPGDGRGIYNPGSNPMPRGPQPSQAAPQIAQQGTQPSSGSGSAAPSNAIDPDRLTYREPTQAAAANVNWHSAIREVGKVASLGGGDGLDLGQLTGGEKGWAETGPFSFETGWFPWGDYAQTMVNRIRVNWYRNMPAIVQTGMQGVVTIRFTIQRDGRITDVTVLESSTIPPYDFAARKGIELSSALPPLPTNFPNPTERVTAIFYYNKRVD